MKLIREHKVNRTFIEVPLFTKRWKEIGLKDDDLLRLIGGDCLKTSF